MQKTQKKAYINRMPLPGAALLCALWAVPATAAELPESLDLSLTELGYESDRYCGGPMSPCASQFPAGQSVDASQTQQRFTSGLELGAIGPVRLKFTGKRLKVRILF